MSTIDNCFGSLYFTSCVVDYYLDQDYVGSMSHKKLFFYHLPTQGRVGVKLGMLIRDKRIYNFLLIHACFISLSHVFTIL